MTQLAHLSSLLTRYRFPLLIAAGVLALALAVLLAILGRRLVHKVPPGTPWWYYAGAVGGLAVSLNTSWRFFGDRLGVTGAERVVMFAVIEAAFVACALGMRANVRHLDSAGRPGSAGAPRLVAWALCVLAGYAALVLSGPVDGIARIALGPVLSMVMLHLALGIEIRHRTGVRTGTWARVVGELRERALSRFGLADDDRDAVTRTRERAATRAARLALSARAPWRATRLARALRTAHVAHDPSMRDRMLAELAMLRSAEQLAALEQRSPWIPSNTETSTPVDTTGTDLVTGDLADDDKATEPPTLHPAASDDTLAAGELDGLILATNADDTGRLWGAEPRKNDAIDRADALLPGRTPRQLVAALAAVGVAVAESSVRRRRLARTTEELVDEQPVARRAPRPRSAIR